MASANFEYYRPASLSKAIMGAAIMPMRLNFKCPVPPTPFRWLWT